MLVPKFKLQHFVKDVIAAFTPIPGILLRLALLIPLGLYQSIAKTHWKSIERFPELGDAYSLQVVSGEHMAYKWSQINFYYHLAILIPSTFLLPPINIFFAVPDIVLLAYLGLTITSQKSYWPDNMDCKNPASLSNPVFLQAAASLGLLTNVERACKDFERQRNLSVVSCALIASVVFFNICDCFFACVRLAKEAHSPKAFKRLAFWDELLPTFMIPFRDFGVLCFWILIYVPCLAFRRLPASIQSRVLLAMRCGVKYVRARYKRTISIQGASVHNSSTPTSGLQKQNTDAPLAKFLSVYDILVIVSIDLHYVDLTNLSLVSRRIHHALLPALTAPNNPLHKYTCTPGIKLRCYICPNQICRLCCFRRQLYQSHIFYDHLVHCIPHCSKCYLKTLREPRVGVDGPIQILTRRCACRHPAASTTPPIPQGANGTRGNNTLDESRIRGGPILVCWSCVRLSDAQFAEIGMRALEREMQRRVTTASESKEVAVSRRCPGCMEDLGNGTRWWICVYCNKECRSELHGF